MPNLGQNCERFWADHFTQRKGIFSRTIVTFKQDAARMQIMKREQVRTVPRRPGFWSGKGAPQVGKLQLCEPWLNNWVRCTDLSIVGNVMFYIYIYIYIYLYTCTFLYGNTDCDWALFGMHDHTTQTWQSCPLRGLKPMRATGLDDGPRMLIMVGF